MANVVNHCKHGAGAPNHDCDLQDPKDGPGVDANGNPVNKPFTPGGPKPTTDPTNKDFNKGPGVDANGNPVNKPFVPRDLNKPHSADRDQDPNDGPGVVPPKPPVGPGV